LGYWVYVPRYAYEVQRRDAVDIFVPQTNFEIMFEKASTPKKSPVATCSILGTGNAIFGENGQTNKDYSGYATPSDPSDDCNLNKTYGAETGTTWATHPAFSMDKNQDNDTEDANEELNGIWIGKYEVGTDTYCYNASTLTNVCGANIAPNNITIKPNQAPMTYKYIGAMFTMAKNMSPNASSITGGNSLTDQLGNPSTATNTMNLTSSSITYMNKNSDWGAVAYLSTSKYGTTGQGNAKVYNNGHYDSTATANSASKYMYKTGCGPVAAGSDAYTPNATCNTYETTLGQTASTTGNVYGIYDFAGGTWEYVMGNRTTSGSQTTSSATYLATPITNSAYYDAYRTTAALGNTTQNRFGTQPTGSDVNEYFYNNDICLFETCGGQALHETKIQQSVSANGQSWGSDYARFADSSYPWFYRGGSSGNGGYAGVFASGRDTGSAYHGISFRPSLSAF
jgi:hypothetical protein